MSVQLRRVSYFSACANPSYRVQANVLSIAFSSDNTRMFSSGLDAMVLMHDLETGTAPDRGAGADSSKSGRPVDVWLDHDVS